MRWLPLLVLLLAACQPLEPIPYNSTYEFPEEEEVRPEIPRTYEEPEPEPQEQSPNAEAPPVVGDIRPHLSLEVPQGSPIGMHHPLTTGAQFPLLRHRTIEEQPGVPLQYDEEILFWRNGTGKVIFGLDDDTDEVGTFLLFEEGRTIFEYRARLHRGTFEGLQGRDIQILGHTYVISYADNDTVALYGRDIESNLLFTNGSRLVVDSRNQQDTEVRVQRNMIAYRLVANGHDRGSDILLSPGESLSENVGQGKLASLLFDIRYAGTKEVETDEVRLDLNRLGYTLTYDGPDGSVEVPLADHDGTLILGRADERLHIKPCPPSRFCIEPGDAVLLSNRFGDSAVLTYSDVSEQPATLIMRSTHNEYHYDIVGNLSRGDAWTQIPVGRSIFRARIGKADNRTGRYNLSIDLPLEPELYTRSGFKIRIKDVVQNRTLPLEVVVPSGLSLSRREERLSLNITHDGDWTITVGGNVTLVEEDGDEDVLGQTPFGVAIFLDQEDRPLPINQAEELTVLLPREQIFGIVRLEG